MYLERMRNEQLNYDWILEGSLFARGNFLHRLLHRSHSSLLAPALRFLSHPSVTTASIMWEIVSGTGCCNSMRSLKRVCNLFSADEECI